MNNTSNLIAQFDKIIPEMLSLLSAEIGKTGNVDSTDAATIEALHKSVDNAVVTKRALQYIMRYRNFLVKS
ncbi:hypothetical protein [uncultured Mucilaginibacter sp.]|uniref:hypothetical protein n=1 Tax=uncultured Mucilaginibacter sp. TaxID=797541 RepID=UPI0025FCB8F8|nr:hypothetical protein [uncultured Mucilaginibacter sp.]